MSLIATPTALSSQGGDLVTLTGAFDTGASYVAKLIATDNSLGPTFPAESSLNTATAAGFTGTLPINLLDAKTFPPYGRLVIDNLTAARESIGYTQNSDGSLALAGALTHAHASYAYVQLVLSGVDTVPPFTLPMLSGATGRADSAAPRSAQVLELYSPTITQAETLAYTFLQTLVYVPGSETFKPGPVQVQAETRTFQVLLTSLRDGSTMTSGTIFAAIGSFYPSSVYEMRSYLSNFAAGPRNVAEEGALWGS